MTENERRQIINLRLKGLGYKAIGKRLSMSRDIVRGFCKRNGIDGITEAAKLNYEERVNQGMVCQNCGAKIEQLKYGRRKKFCSDKCRSVWWTKNYAMHNFGSESLHKMICAGCGKTFTSYSNKKRKYCSHNCYIKSRFGGEAND